MDGGGVGVIVEPNVFKTKKRNKKVKTNDRAGIRTTTSGLEKPAQFH